VFETLSNQINDETFNQIQQKLVYYKQLHDEAFIMANIEIKKQDAWTKQRRVRNDLQRFGQYELPNRSSRYGSGWNR
jgi:lipopolysaccharide export LptBFGC system permease protein LptF